MVWIQEKRLASQIAQKGDIILKFVLCLSFSRTVVLVFSLLAYVIVVILFRVDTWKLCSWSIKFLLRETIKCI